VVLIENDHRLHGRENGRWIVDSWSSSEGRSSLENHHRSRADNPCFLKVLSSSDLASRVLEEWMSAAFLGNLSCTHAEGRNGWSQYEVVERRVAAMDAMADMQRSTLDEHLGNMIGINCATDRSATVTAQRSHGRAWTKVEASSGAFRLY